MIPELPADTVVDIVETLLAIFPAAQKQLLEKLERRPIPNKSNGDGNAISPTRQRDSVVWTASPRGPVRAHYVSRQSLGLYLARQQSYDIFIKPPSALMAGAPLCLSQRLLWLLIFFLRYRNQDIPSVEAYRKALGLSEIDRGYDEKYVLQGCLRFAVSGLRHRLKPLIQRGRLAIPQKSRESHYRCQGSFSFCIILDRDLEPRATLTNI